MGCPPAADGSGKDFNVVPTDADIYSTRSFKDNALLQPEPRAAYAQLLTRAGG